MGSGIGERMRRVSPVQAAMFGAILVALLLIWPIRIGAGGGDDPLYRSCGNALAADVSRWTNAYPGELPTRDRAFQACTEERVDRIALAVGVLAATLLGVTVLRTREQWRPDPPN